MKNNSKNLYIIKRAQAQTLILTSIQEFTCWNFFNSRWVRNVSGTISVGK